jgi:hypothetical protein
MDGELGSFINSDALYESRTDQQRPARIILNAKPEYRKIK